MATSPLSSIIKAEQSNTFFLLFILIKEGPPFLKEIHRCGTKLTDPNESLTERIRKKTGISSKVFRSRFSKSARDKMENDLSMDSFDISLWYLILQHDCDDLALPDDNAWTNQSTLEGCLKSIKDIRNNVMHSDFSVSDTDFYPKLEELRDLLVDTAKQVKSRISLDQSTVDRFIKSFNDTINAIRDDPWGQIDWNSYNGTPLFNTLKTVLERDGRNDLYELFKQKFSYVNPAALIARQDIPILVTQIFTPLQIVEEEEKEKEKHLQHKGEKELNSQKSKSGATNQTVPLDDILEVAHNENKEIILLEGIAGVGKTTIIQKLMLDWTGSSTVKKLDTYYYIIPVQCRDRGYDSICRLVSALMPTARQIFREDIHLMDFVLRFPTLFIFDGADEMTDEAKKIFTEFLGLKMKDSLCIITTRPEKCQEMRYLISNRAKLLHLRVMGVAEEKREDFIIKYHKSLQHLNVTSKENADGLLSYLRTTGDHLQEHWSLPLNLTLVTLLWGIDSTRVRSVTCPIELMIQIRDISLVRLKERLVNKGHSLLDLDEKITEFVALLSEIALIGIRDSNLMIPQSEIEKLKEKCAALNLPSEELLGAFLLRKTSWSAAAESSSFSFPHKSGQEFYAASDICNKVFGGNIDDELQMIHKILKRKAAPKFMLNGVEELIKKGKGKLKTVTEVLSEIEREIDCSPTMVKYQGCLTYLLGLLHYYISLTTKDFAIEMIGLLTKAGVKRREDWITLLNGVRCDKMFAETLIEINPDIVEGEVKIRDVNVFALSSLLREKIPGSVDIQIKGRTSEIPALDDLFKTIGDKGSHIKCLDLYYLFIQHDDRFMDSLLHIVKKCPVEEKYIGRFPSGGRYHPPTGLLKTEKLWISLTDAKDATAFFTLLQARERDHQPLKELVLSIGQHLNPDVIQSIPRGTVGVEVGFLSVFFPDIEDDDEGGRRRVGDILRNLDMEPRQIRNLYFPRYYKKHPDASSYASGIQRLLVSLRDIQVKWSIVFPLGCRPQREDEERLQGMCWDLQGCRKGIDWGRVQSLGDIGNMDSWESSASDQL